MFQVGAEAAVSDEPGVCSKCHQISGTTLKKVPQFEALKEQVSTWCQLPVHHVLLKQVQTVIPSDPRGRGERSR